jgi:hypothetical protein
MALKFFGPNRMAAQQGVEDSGSSLVRQRPSWGMGPQNMPGSFDYNPSGMESKRGGQGGWGVKEPNAYERGGFFWNGQGVSQGTPIAHQDQRMRLAENEDVRRYAQQALDDKKHNLNVRDVDSRIRMADRGFEETQFQNDRRFGLDERKFGADVRIADRGFNENVRQADRQWGVVENQEKRATEIHGERGEVATRQAQAKRMEQRSKGMPTEQALAFFQQFSKKSPYFPSEGEWDKGTPKVTQEALNFVNHTASLMADPRLAHLEQIEVARLAHLGAQYDDQGRLIVIRDGKRFVVNPQQE